MSVVETTKTIITTYCTQRGSTVTLEVDDGTQDRDSVTLHNQPTTALCKYHVRLSLPSIDTAFPRKLG